MPTRRLVLMLLLMGLAGQAIPSAQAKDGDGGEGGEGGNDGGGNGGNDSGGGGDDDGGGNDDSDHDDSDSDSDDDSSDDGPEPEKSDNGRIRNAVRNGQAQPLRNILSKVRQRYKGEVVRIRLTGSGKALTYRIRVIDRNDKLIEVRVNATTGRIIKAAGVK